jgi:hypothetical protein
MDSQLSTLPTNTPAEIIDISPEALEVANCYLQNQSIPKVADDLGIPVEVVTQYLARREVKSYIDSVFMDLGFNNRFKLRRAMDALLAKKFQELDEAGIGSNKDIAELMALSHKMSMEEMDRQIALKKLEQGGPKMQTNIQINENGSNYGSLIERLINNQI